MEKELERLQKKYGSKVFRSSEAPPVKIITTGIPSLDAAVGIGGFPRGTVVEIFGKASVGKSALTYYTIAAVQRAGGYAAYINLESNWSTQSKWAERIAGVDNSKLVVGEPEPGQEAINLFLEMVSEGIFDVVVFDSVGAMSTDKELKIGESKQAFGQSSMVAQMAKNAAFYANQTKCVPIILNQIRDEQMGNLVGEKAPGGRAKEHMSTLRIHLKQGGGSAGKKDKVNGEDIQVMTRINARIVKNKVAAAHQRTGWNFWHYPSPEGVIGIDVLQNAIDAALQFGIIERGGAWYKHELFPEGKLMGASNVIDFLKADTNAAETIRRELVMSVYHSDEETSARETLADVE